MLRERKGGQTVLGLLDIGTHKVCCIIAAAERPLGDGANILSSYRVAGVGLTAGAVLLTLSGVAGWRATGRCADHQKKTHSKPPDWEPF